MLTRTRSRHVKCDGQKPRCRRCTRSGRQCETTRTKLIQHPSNVWFDRDEDSAAWNYFWVHVKSTMTSHHYHEFWNTLIPWSAVHEPAIRFAVAALGSLRRSWTEPEATRHEVASLSLEQYNTAIRHLLSPGLTFLTALIASMMFAQYHLAVPHSYLEGVRHLRSGIMILVEARELSKEELEVLQRFLIPMFRNFASGMLRDALKERKQLPKYLGSFTPSHDPNPAASFPNRFESLQQARTCLQRLLDQIFPELEQLYRGESSCRIKMKVSEGKELLQIFYRKLLTWLNCSARLRDADASRDANLLRIQYLVSYIHFATVLSGDETMYDNYSPFFQDIVNLCSLVLETEKGAVMSFEPGIIPALDLVAQKCRKPQIRRRAINVIDSFAPTGVLRSHAAVTAWHMIVWVEECGQFGLRPTSGYVPIRNRIRPVSLVFDPGRNKDADDVNEPYVPPHWRLTWQRAVDRVPGEILEASFPVNMHRTPTSVEWKFRPQAFEFRRGFEARTHEMRMSLVSVSLSTGVTQPWQSGIDIRLF